MTSQNRHWRLIRGLALAATTTAILGGCAAPQATTADRPAIVDFSSCAKPNYPYAAATQNRMGTVIMEFDVTAEGLVTGSRVKSSSGHPDLDLAALVPISKCRFRPGMVAGQPTAGTTRVEYRWVVEQ
jgi:TonB family protein